MLLALLAIPGTVIAKHASLEEMDAYAQKLSAEDLVIAAKKPTRELWVAPGGKAENEGTKDSPLDLATALSDTNRIKAGDLVWLRGGTYMGPFEKPAQPAGTREAPIIYRAAIGERATITAPTNAPRVLVTKSDHTWFWGLEMRTSLNANEARGDMVNVAGGDGLKLINLVIHDTHRNGIGGWATGNDHEFYGCLVYRVGYKSEAYLHGIYTQNSTNFTVKRISDCLFFDTYGFGVHGYTQEKAMANYLFDGVAAFGNSIAEGSEKPVVNFVVGGYKDAENIIARNCFTYFPPEGKFKRGADFGYVAKHNGNLLLERNTFVGGKPAVHVVNWDRAIVRENRVASPHGLMHLAVPEKPDLSKHSWTGNQYVAGDVEKPFSSNTDPYRWRSDDSTKRFRFDEWKAAFGIDKESQILSIPKEPWVYTRVNRYEPDRVHLFVYNWPRTADASLDLGAVLTKGQSYRIMDARDIWEQPVTKGTFDGKPVTVKLTGPYAPEFGSYVLFRETK